MALSYNEYTTQEAVNRLARGGAATSGGTSDGVGTAVKAVARDTGDKQTRLNGQIADIITDLNENQWVREAYAPLAEDNVAGVIKVEMRYLPFAISTATTTTVKSGAGFLHRLYIAGGTLGAVTVYDNTAASGTVLLPTVTPTSNGVFLEDISFTTGFTVVTAAATVITGAYR